MPAKWQKWMPLDIDQFWSSPSVQRMSDSGKIGYLALICAQWHSDDGSLSSDMDELAIASRLSDESWEANSAAILRKFTSVVGNRLRNEACFQKWLDAKTIFEARQASAKKTNTVTARSPHGHRTVTDPIASRSAYTRTDTETVTKKEKQKPSGETAPGDARHTPFRLAIVEAWPDGEAPWNGREGGALGKLLAANPKLTLEGFHRLLKHRRESEGVNLAVRPHVWLERITDYGSGPLNRYGQPLVPSAVSRGLKFADVQEYAR